MDIEKTRERILELDRIIAGLDLEIFDTVVRRNKFAAERKNLMSEMADLYQGKIFK